MKRIILHWTAGTYRASGLDRQHYHFIVEGDGNVVEGVFPPEANISVRPGKYAAHTLNCNTSAIGVAVAAMAGASERPFDEGEYPITEDQIVVLVRLVAQLAKTYGITIARDTVLTHAEVQQTLGIRQRGKWDITWLPGMVLPADPVFVGDVIRRRVLEELKAGEPAGFLSTLLKKIGVKK